MAKMLRCRDLGFDCDGVVRGDTDEEVLQQASMHARDVHGLNEIPEEVVQKAAGLIQDERSAPTGL